MAENCTTSYTLLSKHLDDAGLDPTYWIDTLKSKLGITSINSLKHLDKESLKTLGGCFRHSWEQTAFESMIGFKEMDGDRKKQLEAEQYMVQLAELQHERRSKYNEFTAGQMEDLRRLLEKKDVTESCNDGTKSSIKIIEDVKKIVDNRKGLSKIDKVDPKVVVEKASGGLLLCGILLTGNGADVIKRRKQLIKQPENIQIKGPVFSSNTKVIEIKSKSESDNFARAVENAGYSMAASMGVSAWMLAGKGIVFKSQNKQSQKEQSSSTTKICHTQVISTLVPTGSIELYTEDLHLSEGSLKTLIRIEQLCKALPPNDYRIQTACEKFFSTYGSHVHVGIAHVGGIYECIAAFWAESNSSPERIRAMVQNAGNAFASSTWSGKGIVCIGGQVSGDYLQQKGNFETSCDQEDLSKTELQCQTWGGPPDASCLSDWKIGLISDSSTWFVIDRGEMQQYDQFFGIWDLVRNHPEEFENASEFSRVLLCAWQEMTEITVDDSNGLLMLVADFKSNVEDVVRKASNRTKVSYQSALCQIVEQKQICEKKLQSFQPWLNLLKENRTVSAFLLKAIQEKHEYDDIKEYISELMAPADISSFSEAREIILWLEGDQRRPYVTLSKLKFSSVSEFLARIPCDFRPNVEAGCEHITKDIELAVKGLLGVLLWSNPIECTFLLSMLAKFKYNIESENFENPLTLANLRELTEESRKKLNTLYRCKENSKVQMQSYLVHLVIENINVSIDQKSKEAIFSRILDPVTKQLTRPVKEVINSLTDHSPFKFKELSDELEKIRTGDSSFTSRCNIAESNKETIPDRDLQRRQDVNNSPQNKKAQNHTKSGGRGKPHTASGSMGIWCRFLKILGCL